MCINLTQKSFKIDRVNSCKLHYQFILKKYLKYLKNKELSDEYIWHSIYNLKKFFNFIRKNNICHISKITKENILKYIASINNYQQSTKYCIVSGLRSFLRFLYFNNFVKTDLSLFIPKMKINHNNKIPHTIWTAEEIRKILNAINRNSNVGKRDYAILILMINLGLRFSDIKNLKFENIDWQKNIIHLVQSKTRKYITLPLFNDVGLALIDYIKNGRLNVNSQYIFLNSKNMNFTHTSSFYNIFRKYLKLANIDISNKKCIGTYSLRHSLATTLLQNRVPLSTISGILGHTDINNTAIYLKVDISSLRECCLDLEVK